MKLYRYYDTLSGHRVSIELEVFTVIKETPCGYWYIPSWMSVFPESSQQENKRWVSQHARVSHCYPTKDLAWRSYCARKYHQSGHLQRAQHRLNAVLGLIEKVGHIDAPAGAPRLEGNLEPGSLFLLDL